MTRAKAHARCRGSGDKTKYRTLEAALLGGQRRLAYLLKTRPRLAVPVLWVYECRLCGRYHLTSHGLGRRESWRVPDPEGMP